MDWLGLRTMDLWNNSGEHPVSFVTITSTKNERGGEGGEMKQMKTRESQEWVPFSFFFFSPLPLASLGLKKKEKNKKKQVNKKIASLKERPI